MNSPLKDKQIVLGVTGSIAAYKSAVLLRLYQKAGASVRVVMTEAAARFVAPLTFSTLSRKPVLFDLWDDSADWTQHVKTALSADALVVAPCSANTLAKFANGICDNMLTAVYLSAACPVAAAPAMDREMYAHPATRRNLDRLAESGARIIEPETGYLSSGLEGAGRLAEPEAIFAETEALLSGQKSAFSTAAPRLDPDACAQWQGKRLLISSGPTREAVDPVRYLSNHSTGKMGCALARAAVRLGAAVTVVSGPVHVQYPPEANVVPVETAEEMREAIIRRAPEFDAVIMAAAVSDYRPKHVSDTKIKKGKSGALTLELEPTTDILAELGKNKAPGQVLAGFALETDNERANAAAKLDAKNLDLIALNSLRDEGAGFGFDTNKIAIIDWNRELREYPLASKAETAGVILKQIARLWKERNQSE